jgi:cytochrome c556
MNEPRDPSAEPAAEPGSWERRSRSVGFGIFVLALGVLAGAGARSANSHDSPAAWPQGKQEVVTLTAAQRDVQVQDMQAMLRAMQSVMNAAEAMDIPKIRDAAQGAGMAAIPPENTLGPLPKDYRAKLMDTHAAFDAMADAVHGFTARDSVLAHLSDISHRCVACHAAYKFGPTQ